MDFYRNRVLSNSDPDIILFKKNNFFFLYVHWNTKLDYASYHLSIFFKWNNTDLLYLIFTFYSLYKYCVLYNIKHYYDITAEYHFYSSLA